MPTACPRSNVTIALMRGEMTFVDGSQKADFMTANLRPRLTECIKFRVIILFFRNAYYFVVEILLLLMLRPSTRTIPNRSRHRPNDSPWPIPQNHRIMIQLDPPLSLLWVERLHFGHLVLLVPALLQASSI